LPDKHLHEPWLAPDNILEAAGVTMDETYPKPVVDHAGARESALAAFATIRD
jgi:deoxyribodipyrimidine photo-lyase